MNKLALIWPFGLVVFHSYQIGITYVSVFLHWPQPARTFISEGLRLNMRDTSAQMITEALFKIAKLWNQPDWMSMEDYIKICIYLHLYVWYLCSHAHASVSQENMLGKSETTLPSYSKTEFPPSCLVASSFTCQVILPACFLLHQLSMITTFL